MKQPIKKNDMATFWARIREEAERLVKEEPLLASFYHATLLKHEQFCRALSYILAEKLSSEIMPAIAIREVIDEVCHLSPDVFHSAVADAIAIYTRDPAVEKYSTPLLYFKGFHALESYRVANVLWENGRKPLALFLQSQIAQTFGVDIHPGAKIGCGVMFDHATGIVIGETCVIENDVSIMQMVTLGGTGKECGDRHPKIREGVMIGTGATILGNIEIGVGAKIGAGSVVLSPVPAHTTVAGIPAKIVGQPKAEKPALDMDQQLF